MGWNLETNVKGPTNGMRFISQSNQTHGGIGSYPPNGGETTCYATYNYNKPAGATFAHIAHGAAAQTDVQWTYVHWKLIAQLSSTGGYVTVDEHALHTDGDQYQSHNTSLHSLLDVRNETHFHLFVNTYQEGGWINTQPVGIQVTWYGPTI